MSCKCSSCSKTFNPYSGLGAQHGLVLDALVEETVASGSSSSSSSGSACPACVSFEEFTDALAAVVTSWEKIAGPVSEQPAINNRLTNPFADVLCGVAARSINHFWNSTGIDGYNSAQRKFIDQMLYEIYDLPPDLIACYYSNCDIKLSRSSMSDAEKNPLFMATAIGKGSVNYWLKTAGNPGAWSTVLHSNYTIRHAKIGYQVCATVKGALIGAAQADALPHIYPLNGVIGIIAVQIAGASVGGGTVLLNLLPRKRQGR